MISRLDILLCADVVVFSLFPKDVAKFVPGAPNIFLRVRLAWMLCAKLSVFVEVVDPALFRRRASDLLIVVEGQRRLWRAAWAWGKELGASAAAEGAVKGGKRTAGGRYIPSPFPSRSSFLS